MGPAEELYLFVQHAARRFRAMDAELDLTPARFSVLAALRYGDARRVGELAAIEGVAQPTMTKLVGGLARDGLVRRREDGNDQRGTVVELTPAGRALVRRARARKILWIEGELADREGRATGRPGERRSSG